jgi:hypothetical protein
LIFQQFAWHAECFGLPAVRGLLSTLLLLGGCLGQAPDSPPVPGGAPSDTPSPQLAAFEARVSAGAPMMRNLSNREYVAALSDLVGEPLSLDLVKDWTATTQYSGFDAVPWNQLDTKAVRDRADTLEAILDRAAHSTKVMTCTATAATDLDYPVCASHILEPLAARAFRRPLSAEEVTALQQSYHAAVQAAQALSADPPTLLTEGVRVALGTIFLAPQFITKVEPPPADDFHGERALTSFEVASRLSFLLAGSLPDDPLWAVALDGTLADPQVVAAQAARLIDAGRAGFVQRFMGQWLDFRQLDASADGTLEQAMWNESWRTLDDLVASDRPVTDILRPGFTYLNDLLAKHYGINGTFDAQFQRVSTDERGGVLAQGAWLTLSATPLGTKPIHRGRVVQDRLLCKIVPPPDSTLFKEIQSVIASIPATATVKERLETHRTHGAACQGCHQYMDPIGLGLEGFDQEGRTRTQYDSGAPIETDGDLLGKPFANFAQLNQMLAELPEFERCTAEKLAVFGLGRVLDGADLPADAALLDYLSFREGGQAPSVREMLLRLVRSSAFLRVVHP